MNIHKSKYEGQVNGDFRDELNKPLSPQAYKDIWHEEVQPTFLTIINRFYFNNQCIAVVILLSF